VKTLQISTFLIKGLKRKKQPAKGKDAENLAYSKVVSITCMKSLRAPAKQPENI